MTTSRRDAGKRGEMEAARYLSSQGMTFVAANYFTRTGEVDLVMRDGETLVFVEVKKRVSGRFGTGEDAVTNAKRRRIYHAALGFIQAAGKWDQDVRFDVVALQPEGVRHYRAAFVPDSDLTYY